MQFALGFVNVSWVPPFDNYNTITSYTLQLGTYNAISGSVKYANLVSGPIPGTKTSTTVNFVYGNQYYFRISATNHLPDPAAVTDLNLTVWK